MAWILFFIAVGYVFYYKGKYENAERLRRMHCRHSEEWERKYKEKD